jgi:UDP-N-acetylglucosamine--N-acetylmuramyl-(pentapeptide) pyrophosphoryl-undecaprenol N-acetylglucosamine transferase
MSIRILFVGGGTGGHFYPLMAVAEVLNESDPKAELYYMGPEPYSATELERLNIKFIYCPAGKLRLYFSIQNFFDMFRNFFGLFVAVWKLYVLYPDVVFSKGGYTSVPVLLAARFLRIPVVIHESDAVPGRANLLARKFSKYIAVAYKEAATFFDASRTALIGIPLRRSVIASISDPHAQLGIPNDLPLIYVTGGSLGAEKINNITLRCLNELLPHYRIFHQVGPNRREETIITAKSLISDETQLSRYYVADTLPGEQVNALMSAAAIVISRAGSTTLFEIATHGKPAVVVPIPEDISRDQRSNAYAFARLGAATVIEEHNLTETLLTNEINSIIGNAERWQSMSQAALAAAPRDAASKVAGILLQIGQEHYS